MENPDNPRRESPWRSFMLRYGCAVVSTALSIWVRLLLTPLVGDHSRYAILLLAILVTAAYGGGRPALMVLILGLCCTYYFLIPPRKEFGFKGTDVYLELVLYSCVGLGVALICGFMRNSSLRNLRNLQIAQETLLQTEKRLNLTLRSSGIGIWSWDIARNIVKAD